MRGGGCSCHLCFLPGGKGEKIPKEIREKLTSDFRMIAEYAARRQDPDLLEDLLEDKVHTIKHPEEFLEMLSEVANDKRYKNAKEKLLKNEEENVTMCVIAEKLENRGIQKGIERGQVLLIKNLIEDGRLEIAEGAKYLNMSVEELSTKILD